MSPKKYHNLTSGEKLEVPWYSNPFLYYGAIIGTLLSILFEAIV